MKLTLIPVTLALAAGLVATTAVASGAWASTDASASTGSPHAVSAHRDRVCFGNMKHDATELVLSENFVSGGEAYDTNVANPMTLTRRCAVRSVFADGGYFRGSGPAVNETVTIYADAGGAPGSVISQQTVAGTDDVTGYTIPIKVVRLDPGQYWIGVVSNQAFSGGGQWGWERSTSLKGGSASYENPGDGWGTGCTAWTALTTCEGGDGVNVMFQVRNY